MKKLLCILLCAATMVFSNRYFDPELGMWISPDPVRQFESPYVYTGNGFNPINGVDPDGNEIIAVNPRDQIVYAAWTQTLAPAQAQKIYALEQSDVKYYFEVVDNLIPTGRLDPKTYSPILGMGEMKPHGDGSERSFDISVWVGGGWDLMIHEFTHGTQSNDFLQANPSATSADWGKEYRSKMNQYEIEAYKAEGVTVTEQDLKNEGYN